MSDYELIALNTSTPQLQAPYPSDRGMLRAPLGLQGSSYYQYLVGSILSLASNIPAFVAGDLVTVSAYNSASAKCFATWKCTSIAASLPPGASAANVTGAALGDLYLSNGSGAYYKLEIVGEAFPAAFGAFGDGATDDSAAVLAALNTGNVVNGNFNTYAVTGSISPTNFGGAKNITLKQLVPSTSNCKTLYLDGFSDFALEKVKIDRNGGTTVGTLSAYSGIYITGSPDNFILRDVEVYNGGPGSPVAVIGGTNFVLDHVYVYDMTHNVGATDDIIQGIWLTNCSKFELIACEARNLVGQSTVRYTRGYALGGCSDFSMTSCLADGTDQSFDFTGTVGNFAFTLSGCIADNGGTFGFKFANSSYQGTVTGCVARRCGLAGFIVSGQTEVANPVPRDIDFINCKAINCGSNGVWSGGDIHGFTVQKVNTIDASYPRAIHFVGCSVIDNQVSPTTTHAFSCDVAPIGPTTAGYDKSDSTYCISCAVYGVTNTSQHYPGIQFQAGAYTATGTKSAPDSTWTEVDFNVELYDPAAVHNTASNNANVYIKTSGVYLVNACIGFAANATGTRKVRFLVNGATAAASPEFTAAAHPTGVTSVIGATPIFLATGDNIRVQGWQNSGGALNLDQSISSFSIIRAM